MTMTIDKHGFRFRDWDIYRDARSFRIQINEFLKTCPKEEMDNGTISRSRHAAPAYGTTRFTYQRENIHLQLYALYSAAVSYENLNEEERQKPVIYAIDTNGNPYSPAWYTLNFKAKYQFSSQLAVTAGVENISDQRYRPYS